MKRFSKNDEVVIKGFCKEFNNKVAIVTSVNGSYVWVVVDDQELELLDCECEHLRSIDELSRVHGIIGVSKSSIVRAMDITHRSALFSGYYANCLQFASNPKFTHPQAMKYAGEMVERYNENKRD